VVDVEDGFQEADNHKSRIVDFGPERHLTGIELELIGTGKVGIGTGHDAIIIHDDQLFVRNLGLRVLENTVAVDVPRIINVVVVEDALLARKNHGLIS
jgi:hypothetical protein